MRAKARIALLAVLGLFVFAACDTGVNGGGNDDDTPTASAPVISPTTQNHTDSVSVTMTTSTPGATIYYTTNGATPTSSSSEYSGAFDLSGAGTYTVRAFTKAPGYLDSLVSSRTYTIAASQPGSVAAPSFFDVATDDPLASTTYLGSVTLRGEAEESYYRIYYTLDDTDPTYEKPDPFGPEIINGEELVNNLTIDRPLTFKAIAVDIGATPTPAVSEIVEFDIGIKLLPPIVEYEISLNTWAQLADNDEQILDYERKGLRVYYNGTFRPTHLTVGDEIAFHYTLDGTTPTSASATLDSLAEFMPEEDNPHNQLKVFCRRYEGADTYADSDVVTIDYQRRVSAVVLDRDPAASSADRPIELTMTSALSGADIQYRYNDESAWLTYDAANKPYIFPNFATEVSIRSEKADWASWEGGTVATLDATGLVYLETSGGVANPKVYIYRFGADDVEVTGFDHTPVKIASWNGALYYIDADGLAIYRHNPFGEDQALDDVDQIPASGKITFVTADNDEYPGQTFYYLTFDGTSDYQIWEYVADGADTEYLVFDGFVGMGSSGLWIDDNGYDYHITGGEIDTNGGDDLNGRLDITPDPRVAYDLTKLADGWVYRDGDGDLRFLVAGTDGTDTLVPNVDHGGSISSITGR
jgi:hypothetical protein